MFWIYPKKENKLLLDAKSNLINILITLRHTLQKNFDKNLEVLQMQMKCLEYSRSSADFSLDQE